MTKKLVEKQDTDIINLEDSQNSVEGFENVTGSDLALPLIKLTQRTSNKILEQAPNAKPGDLFNTVSNELYDGKVGILASLCYFEVLYVEFIPMESGGGLVDFHENLNYLDISNVHGKWMTENGNQIIQSNYHYIKMWEPEEFDAVVILSSTQIKQSKMWLSMARSLRNEGKPTDLYYGMYRLTSQDQVTKNFKYKGWNIKFERHPSEHNLNEARLLHNLIKNSKKNGGKRPFPSDVQEEVQNGQIFDDNVIKDSKKK